MARTALAKVRYYWRDDDLKQYFRIQHDGVIWSDHIKVMVRRI